MSEKLPEDVLNVIKELTEILPEGDAAVMARRMYRKYGPPRWLPGDVVRLPKNANRGYALIVTLMDSRTWMALPSGGGLHGGTEAVDAGHPVLLIRDGVAVLGSPE